MYEYRFVGAQKVISKKNGQQYHFVELHDPKTLKNGNFVAENGIDTQALKPGDRVKVQFDIEFNSMRHQIKISKLEKVN